MHAEHANLTGWEGGGMRIHTRTRSRYEDGRERGDIHKVCTSAALRCARTPRIQKMQRQPPLPFARAEMHT